MKKETAIAVILGITMGALIAITLLVVAKKREISNRKIIAPTLSPTITLKKTDGQQFIVTAPKDLTATSEENIKIKGHVPKGSLIIIQSPLAEKLLVTESTDLSVEFPVTYGENVIKIVNYFENKSNDKLIRIYKIKE